MVPAARNGISRRKEFAFGHALYILAGRDAMGPTWFFRALLVYI